MTNTHIDKEAREAILMIAKALDHQYGSIMEDKMRRLFTTLPADGESSPKPEAGEQRVLPEAVEFVQHLERASAIVKTWPEWKQSLLGSLPTPQPAEPKVMPWPADLRTLFLRRILARFETYAPAWATVVSVNSNTHMTVRLDTGDVEEWNTLRRSLLSVEEVHPPQPSEQAKGADWLPPQMEKFDAMARRMDDADMTRWDKNGAKEHVHTPFGLLALGLKERDTKWRSFIESERAQHKAEMEAVKKGASRD